MERTTVSDWKTDYQKRNNTKTISKQDTSNSLLTKLPVSVTIRTNYLWQWNMPSLLLVQIRNVADKNVYYQKNYYMMTA